MAAADAGPEAQAGRYRSARVKRPRPPLKLQPPLTPMIDVTFQLLLFFLLTMQFSRPEGQLPADLPRLVPAAPVAATPLEPVWVHLRRADGEPGRLRIEISQYHLSMASWPDLHRALVRLRTQLEGADVPIIIELGDGVSWGEALNAFNEARRAGFDEIAFARGTRDP